MGLKRKGREGMNERLEEIENKLLQATNEDDEDVVYASICAEAVLEDLQWTVDYAKEQVEYAEYLEIRSENTVGLFNKQRMQEKIEELEEQLETNGSAFHTLENLFIESEQQNKRYREAWKKAKTEAKEHGAGKADEDITDDGKEDAYNQGAQDMYDDFVYEYERALESES